MAVSTVDEYLSVLEKSKLLGSEQLVEAQRLAGESSDAAALARALARENLVSRWQAGTLLALGQRAQLRLGKYKLIQRLGKGGMGTVFLAEHVTMNRRVALKIVPRSIAENRASLERFFAEARAIAALDHPNIVQAYSVDNEMDRYFIVMEFVDGQDLQRMVELNGPLGSDQAANYVRQAAEGLAHAHARNLVHCDIKPSNLLANNQGVIKILDLGLARLKESDEPSGSGVGQPAFGTVDYMAPEQALQSANFDHRADIYSLGCTLYFLLTGHPPFPEGSLAQRIAKHQTQEPRDILLERPGASPKLVEICKRMMAKEPEDRYQSMQELSAALAPWQDGSTGAADARVPQAVKPLDDVTSVAAGADDWLSFLSGPSPTRSTGHSGAGSNRAKPPAPAAPAAKLTKSGKQPVVKGKTRGGFAAALAGVLAFGRAKLGWFNTRQRRIVGAVVGVVLLAAVAGLAALPFLLSQTRPPSQASGQTNAEEKKSPPKTGNGPLPESSLDKKTDASPGPLAKDSAQGKAAISQPEHPPEKPKPIEAKKSPEPAKPVPTPENKTSDPSVAKTDTNPAPQTTVKSAPPEKKPEPPPKPPEVTKPPEAAKSVSLDGLETAVDLPHLGTTRSTGYPGNEAVSLGKLDLDPSQKVDVQLLGGDSICKGNPRFELQKESEGATPGWSVQMVGKNKDAVPIARVWQEGKEWKIQWAADAKEKATLVRFCGLQFSCEKKKHFVALTAPKTVSPLVIDVATGTPRMRLNRDFPLPDASLLRLQILPLDKALPKYDIKILDAKAHPGKRKSVEPVAGDTVPVKGQVMVVFTKERTPRVVCEIAFDTYPKGVQLEMQAVCDILSGLPFNYANLREADARFELMLKRTDSDANPQRKNMQAQIQAMKTTKDQLKALAELAGELDQKALIPFRVYAVLGTTRSTGHPDDEASPNVVIFQSGEVEKPKTRPGVPGTPAKKNPTTRSTGRPDKSKGPATPNIDELDLK